MSSERPSSTQHPVLLCFDGSDDAAAAIAKAAEFLAPRPAVVLTVWESVRVWEPWDPMTIASAPLGRLIAKELDFDQLVEEVATDKAARGVELARAAEFDAIPRVARGKPWKAICEVAQEVAAEPIVIGSRGLGRAQSALLGSVSSAVIVHAKRAVLVGPAHVAAGGAGSVRNE